jgi:hypothetical protein
MRTSRYTLVATTTYNGIFVRDVLLPFLPQFDRSLDALHVPHMGTEIFQTYDGEIVFTGVTKLLWHRCAVHRAMPPFPCTTNPLCVHTHKHCVG